MASLGELGDCPGHLSNCEPERNGHLGPKSISEPGLEPGMDVLGNSPPISRLLPSEAQKTTCHRVGGLCSCCNVAQPSGPNEVLLHRHHP